MDVVTSLPLSLDPRYMRIEFQTRAWIDDAVMLASIVWCLSSLFFEGWSLSQPCCFSWSVMAVTPITQRFVGFETCWLEHPGCCRWIIDLLIAFTAMQRNVLCLQFTPTMHLRHFPGGNAPRWELTCKQNCIWCQNMPRKLNRLWHQEVNCGWLPGWKARGSFSTCTSSKRPEFCTRCSGADSQIRQVLKWDQTSSCSAADVTDIVGLPCMRVMMLITLSYVQACGMGKIWCYAGDSNRKHFDWSHTCITSCSLQSLSMIECKGNNGSCPSWSRVCNPDPQGYHFMDWCKFTKPSTCLQELAFTQQIIMKVWFTRYAGHGSKARMWKFDIDVAFCQEHSSSKTSYVSSCALACTHQCLASWLYIATYICMLCLVRTFWRWFSRNCHKTLVHIYMVDWNRFPNSLDGQNQAWWINTEIN